MTLTVILLAAGEASRMGQPKALLEWRGQPLLRYQVDQLLQLDPVKLIVVLGHEAERLAPLLRDVDGRVWVGVNPDYRKGKSTSVRFGARQAPQEADAVLVIGVDQPRPAALLARLVESHAQKGAMLSIPTYRGKRGHPAVYSASLLPELLAVSEERQGLREVTERHRREVNEAPVDSPLALVDINTPEDYQAALRLQEP